MQLWRIEHDDVVVGFVPHKRDVDRLTTKYRQTNDKGYTFKAEKVEVPTGRDALCEFLTKLIGELDDDT